MLDKPQLEDGYSPIANKLMEALCGFRLPGELRQVLDSIIRMTYGYSRKSAEISSNRFIELTGLSRQNLNRSIRRLISMKIVVKTDSEKDAIYCFNKKYWEWERESKLTQSKKAGQPQKRVNSDYKSESVLTTKGTFIQLYLRKQRKQEGMGSKSGNKKSKKKDPIAISLMKSESGAVLVGLTQKQYDALVDKWGYQDTELTIIHFREKFLTLKAWNKEKFKSVYMGMRVYYRKGWCDWQKDPAVKEKLLNSFIDKRDREVQKAKAEEKEEIERLDLSEVAKIKAMCKQCQAEKQTPAGCNEPDCPDHKRAA